MRLGNFFKKIQVPNIWPGVDPQRRVRSCTVRLAYLQVHAGEIPRRMTRPI